MVPRMADADVLEATPLPLPVYDSTPSRHPTTQGISTQHTTEQNSVNLQAPYSLKLMYRYSNERNTSR